MFVLGVTQVGCICSLGPQRKKTKLCSFFTRFDWFLLWRSGSGFKHIMKGLVSLTNICAIFCVLNLVKASLESWYWAEYIQSGTSPTSYIIYKHLSYIVHFAYGALWVKYLVTYLRMVFKGTEHFCMFSQLIFCTFLLVQLRFLSWNHILYIPITVLVLYCTACTNSCSQNIGEWMQPSGYTNYSLIQWDYTVQSNI